MRIATRLDVAEQVARLVESGEARARRERLGLTVQEAARRCGDVHPTAISLWERGLRRPSGRNLTAYARLLDRMAAVIAQGAGEDAA